MSVYTSADDLNRLAVPPKFIFRNTLFLSLSSFEITQISKSQHHNAELLRLLSASRYLGSKSKQSFERSI